MKPRVLLVSLALAVLQPATPAWAGAGHAHDEPAPAAQADGPRRLADGSVFLPKPTQRQIGLRTQPLQTAELPHTQALAGRVLMHPNAGGRVQALQDGRLHPGPGGFPSLGQAVRKDELLAYVVTGADALGRASQAAQLAQLRAERQLAEQRLARLAELSDTVPRRDLDAARSTAASLAAQIAALESSGHARDALRAPVAGVIASSNALAGQVVTAGELVFEVMDPTRLHIEALTYEPEQARDVAGASLAVGTRQVPLRFIGAARSLREQALPLLFEGDDPALQQLALGQPVRVFVHSASRTRGLRVPQAAVVKNAANQSIVWIKQAPEHFEPRPVTLVALDGVSVALTSGVQDGERVVVQAAGLLNQIR